MPAVFCRRPGPGSSREGSASSGRRVNMVGVNMVLAEFAKFKHGLYKSCGVECFEGIMLEPCLLQPCLHVAGPPLARRRGRGLRPLHLSMCYTLYM